MVIVKSIRLLTFLTLFFTFTASLSAKEIEVVAIVGDKIISNYDVESRLKIVSLSTGKNFRGKNLDALKKQIREMLITEAIQKIEAEKYQLSIGVDELDNSIAQIAKSNNLYLDDFKSFIKSQGISLDSFEDQLRTQLLWQKLVLRKIRPTIDVTDFEITEYINQINKSDGFRYNIKIATFPFTNQSEMESTKKLASKIYSQISQKKAKFSEITKAFGGEKEQGWKLYKNIEKDLRDHVRGLQIKQTSFPILSEDAYYLVYLANKKSIKNKKFNRDQIYRSLLLQKLELKAGNYLQSLKRSIFIERK